jgi:hypothetical protein
VGVPLLDCEPDPFVVGDGVRILGVGVHRHLNKTSRTFKVTALEEFVGHFQKIAGLFSLFLPYGVVEIWHGTKLVSELSRPVPKGRADS